VSQQAFNLKLLKKEFPGITQLQYDQKGRSIVQDLTDIVIQQSGAE